MYFKKIQILLKTPLQNGPSIIEMKPHSLSLSLHICQPGHELGSGFRNLLIVVQGKKKKKLIHY